MVYTDLDDNPKLRGYRKSFSKRSSISPERCRGAFRRPNSGYLQYKVHRTTLLPAPSDSVDQFLLSFQLVRHRRGCVDRPRETNSRLLQTPRLLRSLRSRHISLRSCNWKCHPLASLHVLRKFSTNVERKALPSGGFVAHLRFEGDKKYPILNPLGTAGGGALPSFGG